MTTQVLLLVVILFFWMVGIAGLIISALGVPLIIYGAAKKNKGLIKSGVICLAFFPVALGLLLIRFL